MQSDTESWQRNPSEEIVREQLQWAATDCSSAARERRKGRAGQAGAEDQGKGGPPAGLEGAALVMGRCPAVHIGPAIPGPAAVCGEGDVALVLAAGVRAKAGLQRRLCHVLHVHLAVPALPPDVSGKGLAPPPAEVYSHLVALDGHRERRAALLHVAGLSSHADHVLKGHRHVHLRHHGAQGREPLGRVHGLLQEVAPVPVQGHNEAAGPRSHRDGVEVQTQPGAARELHRHDAGDGCHPLRALLGIALWRSKELRLRHQAALGGLGVILQGPSLLPTRELPVMREGRVRQIHQVL
mmetsp:Transcript_94011/g.223761  ORF Transcript_94011/g.223761 Transcript_94011/m.223761 type:complete len:296 (+) Transcript_94011:131-1018(+)